MALKRAISASAICIALPARSYWAWVAISVALLSCITCQYHMLPASPLYTNLLQALLDLCLSRGAPDNVSIVVVRCQEPTRLQPVVAALAGAAP